MIRALAVALAAACLAAVAVPGCAGGPPAKSSAPPGAEAAAPQPPPRDPRAEIDALDREITAELGRAQLALPAGAPCSGAGCATAMSEPFATPTRSDPACHPAATDRCNDTCTLSTSICRNQERICELARQLDGDDWAAGKCTGARASCRAAHDACCRCVA